MAKSRKPAASQQEQNAVAQSIEDFKDKMGIDQGNAYTNIVVLLPDGSLLRLDWRSVQGRMSEANKFRDLPTDSIIKLDGLTYVFGEDARTFASAVEDWPATNRYTSQFYKRLFQYALYRAYKHRIGEGIIKPSVVMSIPAKLYSNEEYTNDVIRNLSGIHNIYTLSGQCLRIDIEDMLAVPEGGGSQIEAATLYPQAREGTWIVYDEGYLTGDVIRYEKGVYVPDSADSDPHCGIGLIAKAVSKYIEATKHITIAPEQIDPMLTCDAIEVNKQSVSISALVNVAKERLAEKITRFVMKAAAGHNLSGIILTGGGAELLKLHLETEFAESGLPQPLLAPNPRRANVEGAFKIL